MSMSTELYLRGVVARLLEDHGCPELAVEDFLSNELNPEHGPLAAARKVLGKLFKPRRERGLTMLLLGGDPGVGKTVGAVAGLGLALMEAFRRKEQGRLVIDRQAHETEAEETVVTPERVKKVIGVDWDTFGAMRRLHPGVYEAQVVEAYRGDEAWDFDTCPVSFAFWNAQEMSLENAFSPKFARSKEQAKTVDVLIIDDLGADTIRDTGMWLPTVQDVINTRYTENLITLLTTNCTWTRTIREDGTVVEGFVTRYGARIADRLHEAGEVVMQGGPSLRKKRQA